MINLHRPLQVVVVESIIRLTLILALLLLALLRFPTAKLWSDCVLMLFNWQLWVRFLNDWWPPTSGFQWILWNGCFAFSICLVVETFWMRNLVCLIVLSFSFSLSQRAFKSSKTPTWLIWMLIIICRVAVLLLSFSSLTSLVFNQPSLCCLSFCRSWAD